MNQILGRQKTKPHSAWLIADAATQASSRWDHALDLRRDFQIVVLCNGADEHFQLSTLNESVGQ